nr:hypothetical protein CFP56_10986 [Quercus suber]
MSGVIRRFISYVGKDERIKQASVQGTELHQSHKDPTDPKKVISVQFLDAEGKRVGTGHLHEDGTSKFRYAQKPPSDSPSGGFE